MTRFVDFIKERRYLGNVSERSIELRRQWKPQAPEHGNRVTAQKTKLILNGNYSIDEHISNNGRSDRAPMVIGEFDATDA